VKKLEIVISFMKNTSSTPYKLEHAGAPEDEITWVYELGKKRAKEEEASAPARMVNLSQTLLAPTKDA
jgi:hypothetical protein